MSTTQNDSGHFLPIVTIVSKNYLAYARTLARSYLSLYPEGKVFVCLMDSVDGYFDPTQEPFVTILARDLNIPNWLALSFKYTPLELGTALKPFILDYLLHTFNFDRLIFLDPDIVLYNPLSELDKLLDTYGIVLTPHILEPLDNEKIPSEISFLQSGAYNLGFIALSRRADLTAFLAWWKTRLYEYCVLEVDKGLFADQKWIDLVPGMFDGVYIWRDPACNVAYWNFVHRPVEYRAGQYFVKDKPLTFVHYSGFMIDNVNAVSRNQNRFSLPDLSQGTQMLLHDYRGRLLQNGYDLSSQFPYSYGTFDNGVRIPNVVRKMYRELDPNGERWSNPYQIGSGSFFEYLTSKPDNKGSLTRSSLTRLATYIFQTNTPLQIELPYGLHKKQFKLRLWMCKQGAKLYGLDRLLLDSLIPRPGVETLRASLEQQRNIRGFAWYQRLATLVRLRWQ